MRPKTFFKCERELLKRSNAHRSHLFKLQDLVFGVSAFWCILQKGYGNVHKEIKNRKVVCVTEHFSLLMQILSQSQLISVGTQQ